MRLFGVSSASLLAFQCLGGALGSACLLLVLKQVGFSRGMLAIAFLLYAASVLSLGLRPEIFGLACVSGAALAWRSHRAGGQFIGCFLAACAPLFAPSLCTLVLPLGVVWLCGFYLLPDAPQGSA